MKKNNLCIMLIFCLTAFGLLTSAQNKITVDEAIEIAVKNNPQMSAAFNRVEQQKALLPASVNIPKLDLIFENPTGLEAGGFRPVITQTFDFPTVYMFRHKSQKNQIEMSNSEQLITQNMLHYNVRMSFNTVQFYIEKQKVLERYNAILNDLQEVNELRYKVGQISKIEKINAEAKYKYIENMLLQTVIELKNNKYLLALNMGKPSDTSYIPSTFITKLSSPTTTEYRINQSFDNNPTVSYYKNKQKMTLNLLKVERNQWLPGFTVGLYNQAQHADQAPFLQTLRGGFSLPIWAWVNSSRVKGAKYGLIVAEKEILANSNTLNSQFSQALAQFEQYDKSLKYFEETGLLQAKEIISSAQQSYKSGAIGYYFYLQNLDQAFQIELSYLEALKNYNQSIISLNYVLGNI